MGVEQHAWLFLPEPEQACFVQASDISASKFDVGTSLSPGEPPSLAELILRREISRPSNVSISSRPHLHFGHDVLHTVLLRLGAHLDLLRCQM